MRYFILPLIMLVLASVAVAEPYIGLGFGSASYKVDLSAFNSGSFDEKGTGTKLYAGYSFNRYYAAEAALYNFAEASASAESGLFNSAEAEMKGVAVYAVGLYPASKEVSLIAKLGVLDWDADLRVNNTSASNDGTDVAVALAASYAFTKEFLGVIEWEFFDADNPELSMFSAGFRYRFK